MIYPSFALIKKFRGRRAKSVVPFSAAAKISWFRHKLEKFRVEWRSGAGRGNPTLVGLLLRSISSILLTLLPMHLSVPSFIHSFVHSTAMETRVASFWLLPSSSSLSSPSMVVEGHSHVGYVSSLYISLATWRGLRLYRRRSHTGQWEMIDLETREHGGHKSST